MNTTPDYSIIIRIAGYAVGIPSPHDGEYISSYDPDYLFNGKYDGGLLSTTKDRNEAKSFENLGEAMEFWRTKAPAPYSTRQDGEPNRPLTAFNIEIERIKNEDINRRT